MQLAGERKGSLKRQSRGDFALHAAMRQRPKALPLTEEAEKALWMHCISVIR
jgi:hypothetical protein